VSYPSDAYIGTDDVTLASGQTTHFADNIVITHQGAQYVSQTSVSCT